MEPPTPAPVGHCRGFEAVAASVGRHAAVLVVGLALVAAAWAVVGSQKVFPYLSDDHDEGLYLYQADALAHGHLFPPAPRHPDAFRPWLSVVSDGRFVLKYTPVHASFLAGAQWMTGDPRWALGLVAGGVVLLTYALAREVLRDRSAAVLAAAFLALSPMFVVQSATFLSYCSSLLLLEAFAVALLRGLRLQRRPPLVAGGFLWAVALFARPLDALIFAVPLGAYVLWARRHERAILLAHLGWFSLGAAVPLVAMLTYFRAATGSPFRPPFSLLEPQDTLGFGTRRLLPGQPGVSFTPAVGVYGVGRYILLTSFWGFGGLLLIGFFVAGVVRRSTSGPQPWLGLVALTFSAGYLFFWGTYGTSGRGGLTSFLGPFYFLPVLVPVAILGAKGFTALWRHDRLLAAVSLATMVAVSGYLLGKAVQVNLRLTGDDRRLYGAVAHPRLDRALVLLPPLYGPQLLHPFAWLWTAPVGDARVVYALDRGDSQSLAFLGDFPDRAAYRLVVTGRYRANPPDRRLATSLEPLAIVEQRSLDTSLTLRNPTDDPCVVISVVANGRKDSFVLDSRSVRGQRYDTRLSIGAGSVALGVPVEGHRTEPVEQDGSISVSIATGPDESRATNTRYERHFASEVDGDLLRVLLPGSTSVDQLGPGDPLGALVGEPQDGPGG